SAELRFPILRMPSVDGLLQIAPFIDFGAGFNVDSPNPDPNTLVGIGLGLIWRQSDYLTARFDVGFPLVDVDSTGDSLQENGIYFSLDFTPF
ncbi:MAG: BamA/TamA family outer membrane protein, partial [Cyanothece sp. SIO1E1]|nr:BamA/TamA family outer membrane protein [Cyanothece sp. SIO1E1]